MRIALQTTARTWGGNEAWLALVAPRLAARGHEVQVAVPNEIAHRFSDPGITTTPITTGGTLNFVAAFRFARWLHGVQPDVFVLTTKRAIFWGAWAAQRAGVKRTFVRWSNSRPLSRKWRYRYAFQRWIDGVIANSQRAASIWAESAPFFPRSAVHVVYNGVAENAITSPHASTLRAELHLGEEPPLCLAAGRLISVKGFDLLVRAFAQRAPENAHLAIAGTGEEGPALQALGHELGLSSRVHWLGFRSDLPDLLSGADVFVLPSRREGMANVMLEAMAAQSLLVATDVAGVSEAMGERDGRPAAGWIVPPNDVDALGGALAQAIQVARNDAVHAKALRTEALWRIRQWFTIDRTVDQLEAVLLTNPGHPDPRVKRRDAAQSPRPVSPPSQTHSW
jgi:glycosyltransferase involved in cell wall biosynthesis